MIYLDGEPRNYIMLIFKGDILLIKYLTEVPQSEREVYERMYLELGKGLYFKTCLGAVDDEGGLLYLNKLKTLEYLQKGVRVSPEVKEVFHHNGIYKLLDRFVKAKVAHHIVSKRNFTAIVEKGVEKAMNRHLKSDKVARMIRQIIKEEIERQLKI